MNIYTYSEARQQLSTVLDSAKRSGKVLIKRQDGSTFSLVPELQLRSPLDIKGINTAITTKDILSFVRESREA
ncbi:MAG: prevent-host-death protein [Lentisphaerae bacterium RIFOXYA12_FULL_48_11]|nr:MAG: prevent-host-death protein [Lentisphaerae bacterium RIFOXYA12_FULL_48_11]